MGRFGIGIAHFILDKVTCSKVTIFAYVESILNTIKENTKAGDDGVYSTHKNSTEIGNL